jgi:hypothetical protein
MIGEYYGMLVLTNYPKEFSYRVDRSTDNKQVFRISTHILPITSTMANLGIPLTGSTAIGFTRGILKR